MKNSESFDIVLPVYNLIDDLSKGNLLWYCLQNNLKDFFPEKPSANSISRNFILKVIYNKDREKFNSLEAICKSINKFKSEKALGGVNVSVPTAFLQELDKFNSNINTKTNSRVYSLNNSVFMKNNIQVVGLSKTEKKDKRKKDIEEFMTNNNIIRNSYNLERINFNRNSNNNIN